MEAESKTVRLDKWLWAARFYKTRALASEAVNGGKVHLSGNRVKPSRAVKLNDCFELQRGFEKFEIFVRKLSDQRGPASRAQTLYEETADSIERRKKESEIRKLAALQHPSQAVRPDKKQRRKIRQFTGKA